MSDSPYIEAPADTNPASNNSTEAWFDSLQSPTPSPQKKHLSRKMLLVILMLTITVVATLLGVFLSGTSPQCLTSDDLRALTGNPEATVSSPADSFYTYTVSFSPNSSSYAPASSESQSGEQIIAEISAFYKERSRKSFIFTVGSDYTNDGDKALAVSRIQAIKSSLVASGIPQDTIVSTEPNKTDAENVSEQSTTTIDISSATTCK